MNGLALAMACVGLLACGSVNTITPDGAVEDAPDPCVAPNVCECTTATEDADCGAHAYCDTEAPGRTCACVAGYTDMGSGCVFTGLLEAPDFAATGPWTSANGAVLDPTAAGAIDPGEATFAPSALCDLAHVDQTFVAPSFRKAEPLVLELSYKNQGAQGPTVLFGVSFGGTGWSALPGYGDSAFHTVRICLPEGSYASATTTGKGAPVTLAFGPYLRPFDCPNTSIENFAIDHAAIVQANAGECGTTPGEGPNFDAEGSGGFTPSVSGTSTFGFEPGLGVGGSKAATLLLGGRCDLASVSTTFNVPAVENPALDVYLGAGPGANGGIIDALVARLEAPAGGMSGTLHACLPPSLRGQTLPLRFSMSNTLGGSCADVLDHQLVIDNVKVVDDPACGTTTNLTDPGFESGMTAFGAVGSRSSTIGEVHIASNAALAHGGTHYLALEALGRCSYATYQILPTVPMPAAGAGPALTFFANVGINPNAETSVTVDATTTTLAETGTYQKITVCLNPRFVGRPQPVVVRHFGGTGLCDTSNYTRQVAFIDDLAVTTDPSCPTE